MQLNSTLFLSISTYTLVFLNAEDLSSRYIIFFYLQVSQDYSRSNLGMSKDEGMTAKLFSKDFHTPKKRRHAHNES